MQFGDWGNVLIRHVREWKHWKHSPWVCSFSGVKFCGAFHFQKLIFLQLLQIWSSYCFHCDTDQLWTHTQSNNKTKCLKHILLTVKTLTPHLRTFWHLSHIYIYIDQCMSMVLERERERERTMLTHWSRLVPNMSTHTHTHSCLRIFANTFQQVSVYGMSTGLPVLHTQGGWLTCV